MFEAGETYKGFDRIVRIGSHTSDHKLFERISAHFFKENHRTSILRKHIGRCFLVIDERRDYITTWDIKKKKKLEVGINTELERAYEAKITKDIRDRFSFIVIPNLTEKLKRERLEKALIATLAQSFHKKSSEKWLGGFHPNPKIMEGKLWNLQHLKGKPLTEDELKYIIQKTT
jgi:hypothetical protein